MEFTLIAVVGVASLVAVARFSERIGLASPLLLVLVGAVLSFVPGVPTIEVEPEWVLAGVLPPLLYSAAVNMPATDFRRNFKAIAGLAGVLVVVTTVAVAVLIHALLPEIGWPTAFALGAVVSPTDAVAATSIGRRLGLPSRLLAILEGEGLVNDASALVLLRSAIAATGASVSVWHVAGDFVVAVVLATAIGLAVGLASVHVRSRLNDAVLNAAISFVVPFVAYLPAEELGASGVLAVVVTGLATGRLAPGMLRAEDRLSEETNWRTVAFLLEGAIFLLMGLGLEELVREVGDEGRDVGQALAYGLLVAAAMIALRVLFVVPLVASLRKDEERAARMAPELDDRHRMILETAPAERLTPRRLAMIDRRFRVVRADLDFLVANGMGGRGGVVLAWSGMRGAITVAAAQTLPEDTPYRAELLLIAFVGAAATLLLQGSTLPALIRRARIEPDDPERLRAEYGGLLRELGAAGERVLRDEGAAAGAAVVARVRQDSLILDADAPPDDAPDEDHAAYVRLRLAIIAAERDRLNAARSDAAFGSAVLDRAQRLLDVEELRLRQIGDEGVGH
ncbi:cation:proton antiporter [Patulibacter sp. S7RM1-6]